MNSSPEWLLAVALAATLREEWDVAWIALSELEDELANRSERHASDS